MSSLQTYLQNRAEDGVMYLAQQYFANASNPFEKQKAVDDTVALLQSIPYDQAREEYVKQIANKKITTKKSLTDALKKFQKDAFKPDDGGDFLSGLDKKQRDEWRRYGFYSVLDGERTGYYFPTDGMKSFEQKTNFIISPLFHKYDQDDNTRIVKIDDGIDKPEIVEMPSAAMLSVDQFRKFVYDKGSYLFTGTIIHLNKINRRYMRSFPKAFELKTLGWQSEGFFAYFNFSYNGKLEEYNEVGIVKHGDQYFFSPASSEIYSGFREGDDDMFENDRYLRYVETDISFKQWTKLMHEVYDDHAIAGVGYALASLFKDIAFRVDNNFPFLYCYGQSQSGKSKFAESIMALFFVNMPAFQLNAGTDFAFANRLARFRNCPMQFNEFDDTVVKDEWFQAIKGAYDGEGRERGRGGSKRKTEIQKVNCALMLVGQYLSTRDDNSVLSRSIMRTFHKKTERSEDQVTKYEYLKSLEKQGITSLVTELLVWRKDLQEQYYTLFSQEMKSLGDRVRKSGKQYNERVLRNYSALTTFYCFFRDRIDMPWSAEEYRSWAVEEVVELSDMITNKDILTEFWTTIETLVSEGAIRQGEHFKIEQKVKVRVTGRDGDVDMDLGEPKTVLYIRLKVVQQLYAKFMRSMGKGGIDLTSLASYIKNRGYYLGYVKSEHFTKVKKRYGDMNTEDHESIKTSAHLFDLDGLDIALEKTSESHFVPPKNEQGEDEDDLAF